MSHEITIQISDQAFEQLRTIAGSVGRPMADVAAEQVENSLQGQRNDCTNTNGSHQKRLQDFFGSIDMPEAVGCNNEQIDADLAREYSNADEH